MEKNEATLILAGELAKKDYINIVLNTVDQEYLKDNNLGFEIIRDEGKIFVSTGYSYSYGNGLIYNFTKKQEIVNRSKELDSNYIFCNTYSDNKNSIITMVPSFHAIITDKEVPILQNLFYKDVDYDTKEAFEALKIKDFNLEYLAYQDEICDLGGKVRLFLNYGRGTVNGRNIYIFKKEGLEFILNLPKEEQNAELNKNIIKYLVDSNNYSTKSKFCISDLSEIKDIFINLYKKKDTNFPDYFYLLEDSIKTNITDIIKRLKPEQLDYEINTKLYAQGFDVPVKFLDLYKTDVEGFSKYLSSKNGSDQEEIIKIILKLPENERNPDCERFICDNYSGLINAAARKIPERNEIESEGEKK